MVYDCFSFYNELDLLEIRLNVLWDVVDKFVIAEGTLTHTGKPKPLYFNENRGRFAAYADKIIHVIVDDFPEPPIGYTERDASWMREDWQRNAIKRPLKVVAQPNDLILLSDVDEIPTPASVRACSKTCKDVVVFEQMLTNYYLNFVSYTTPVWLGTKAARWSVFNNPETYAKMEPSPCLDEFTNRGATASRLRIMQAKRRLKHAGWHFSYLGGAKEIVKKIGSIAIEFSNTDNTSEQWVEEVVSRGLDINKLGRRFFVVPLDERFPQYLRENSDKYAHLIATRDADYYKRTRWERRKQALRGWIRRNGAKLIPKPFKQFLFDHVYSKLVKDPIVIAS